MERIYDVVKGLEEFYNGENSLVENLVRGFNRNPLSQEAFGLGKGRANNSPFEYDFEVLMGYNGFESAANKFLGYVLDRNSFVKEAFMGDGGCGRVSLSEEYLGLVEEGGWNRFFGLNKFLPRFSNEKYNNLVEEFDEIIPVNHLKRNGVFSPDNYVNPTVLGLAVSYALVNIPIMMIENGFEGESVGVWEGFCRYVAPGVMGAGFGWYMGKEFQKSRNSSNNPSTPEKKLQYLDQVIDEIR